MAREFNSFIPGYTGPQLQTQPMGNPVDPSLAGKETKAVKVTVQITDTSVTTEHAGSRPLLSFEHQFNIESHPYLAKDGTVKALSRNLLFSLEEALGFDPAFFDAQGQPVEPFLTRTGRKVAPKDVEGVTRKLNAEFDRAYFHDDGTPTLNWAGTKVYADIKLQTSEDERYPAKNQVSRFKKVPVRV